MYVSLLGIALFARGLLQILPFRSTRTQIVSQFMVQQFNLTLPGCRKLCDEFKNYRSRWLRPCWDCGFEFCWENRCLSLVSVVCCQVEVSAKGRSLVQWNPTECVFVSECHQVQQ